MRTPSRKAVSGGEEKSFCNVFGSISITLHEFNFLKCVILPLRTITCLTQEQPYQHMAAKYCRSKEGNSPLVQVRKVHKPCGPTKVCFSTRSGSLQQIITHQILLLRRHLSVPHMVVFDVKLDQSQPWVRTWSATLSAVFCAKHPKHYHHPCLKYTLTSHFSSFKVLRFFPEAKGTPWGTVLVWKKHTLSWQLRVSDDWARFWSVGTGRPESILT